MVIHIQKESSLSLFFLWKTKGWVKSKSQMCLHVVHDLYQSQLLFLKETYVSVLVLQLVLMSLFACSSVLTLQYSVSLVLRWLLYCRYLFTDL